MTYDPWADVARRQGVELRWHVGDVEGIEDPLGVVTFDELAITLALGQDEAQLRSTLAHELVHLERGPFTPRKQEREEERVELITAQRLIHPDDFDALMEAAKSRPTSAHVREALRVDWDIFVTYRQWRDRVRATTAHRVWQQQSKSRPAWPPRWLERPAPHMVTAARLAGVTVPATAQQAPPVQAARTATASHS